MNYSTLFYFHLALLGPPVSFQMKQQLAILEKAVSLLLGHSSAELMACYLKKILLENAIRGNRCSFTFSFHKRNPITPPK